MQLDYAKQFNILEDVSISGSIKYSEESENVQNVPNAECSTLQVNETLNGALKPIVELNKDDPSIYNGTNGHENNCESDTIIVGEKNVIASSVINGEPESLSESVPEEDSSFGLLTILTTGQHKNKKLKTDPSAEIIPYNCQRDSERLIVRENIVKALLSGWKQSLSELRKNLPAGVHGLLVPLHEKSAAISMVSKDTTSVGSGSTVHIDLSTYSHCNFISDLHAHIQFNSTEQRFELCNLSSYGTIVNQIRYGPEFVRAPRIKQCDSTSQRTTVTDFLEKKKKELLERIEKESEEGGCSSTMIESCNCLNNNRKVPSWEGPAPLFHGSVVNFGCIEFVFTILEVNKLKEDTSSGGEFNAESKTLIRPNHVNCDKMKELDKKRSN